MELNAPWGLIQYRDASLLVYQIPLWRYNNLMTILSPKSNGIFYTGKTQSLYNRVVFIVGFLAQFLWEAQAHKVSGRYIIGNC